MRGRAQSCKSVAQKRPQRPQCHSAPTFALSLVAQPRSSLIRRSTSPFLLSPHHRLVGHKAQPSAHNHPSVALPSPDSHAHSILNPRHSVPGNPASIVAQLHQSASWRYSGRYFLLQASRAAFHSTYATLVGVGVSTRPRSSPRWVHPNSPVIAASLSLFLSLTTSRARFKAAHTRVVVVARARHPFRPRVS